MLGRYVVGGCLSLPDVKTVLLFQRESRIRKSYSNRLLKVKKLGQHFFDISQSANSFNLALVFFFSVFL